MHGMVSTIRGDGAPKYVWAVDDTGEVYESKIGSDLDYHGYRLGDNDKAVREYVRREWNQRCH